VNYLNVSIGGTQVQNGDLYHTVVLLRFCEILGSNNPLICNNQKGSKQTKTLAALTHLEELK